MKKEAPSRRFRTALSCALWAAILLALAGCMGADDQNVRAERGVFDMRAQPLAQGEVVTLDGEWELYWDRLLTPQDFQPGKSQPEPSGYFTLPGTWRGHELDNERLGATGQATYRLTLLPGLSSGRLTLRLFDIHEAYTLWANGELVAHSGEPGRSAATEDPARSLHLAEIPVYGRPIELVLQVSNHHFRMGGVTEHIQMARPGVLETARARDWGLALFFSGCMLIIGIYHLVLYFLHKRDPAPLYFGLYCLLVVGYTISSNTSQWVASAILPNWPSGGMEMFSLFCYVSWASMLFRFLERLYPDEFHSFLKYFLDARIVLFIGFLLFAPGVPLYWFIALCLIQMMIYATYYLHRLALCIRRGRAGAQILIVGLIIQFLAGINDVLGHLGVIDTVYLAAPAVCLFVLAQSLALAKRFASAFDDVEQLSVELEQKNVSLQSEMEERNRLEQRVVETSEDERRRISHELHDGLCQQLTGARLRASDLAYRSAGTENEQPLKELVELLTVSTSNARRTARGLWPVEHDASMSGPSLESLVRAINKTTDINVSFEKQCHCEKCTNQLLTPLYRIAQESLANCVKHSQAQEILVKLTCCGDGRLTLFVHDDGIGYDTAAEAEGLGTSIMAHRAKIIGAQLHVSSTPQIGTRVLCEAPCTEILAPSQTPGRKLHDD